MARFRGTLCCVPLTVAMRPYRYDVSWRGGIKIGALTAELVVYRLLLWQTMGSEIEGV